MKRFRILKRAIAFALPILITCSPVSAARADGGESFLRVINETTPFYSDARTEEFLFFLPYTYYVKVLSENDGVTHAEIGGNGIKLDGFVPTDSLFNDGLSVENPYPEITLSTVKNTVLYADLNPSSTILYIFPSRNLKYFGAVTGGDEVLYFVSYNGHLGYVKESDLAPFTVPQHPNPLTFIKEDPPQENILAEERPSDVASILRLIVIGSLLLAGVIGLTVSIGKKNKPKKPYYYDENETE